MVEFTDDRLNWEALDRLVLSRYPIQFLVQVQEATGITLREALELLYARYEALRRSRPDDFCCGHDDYWKGFCS